jgi:hypothetical protein
VRRRHTVAFFQPERSWCRELAVRSASDGPFFGPDEMASTRRERDALAAASARLLGVTAAAPGTRPQQAARLRWRARRERDDWVEASARSLRAAQGAPGTWPQQAAQVLRRARR